MTIEKIQQQTTRSPIMGVEMDGSAVFNFSQREVPMAVEELVQYAGITMDEIDLFLFHQPNKFMLQKLAQRLQVPYSKMPMDIVEKLGNSDSGTIAAVMTTDVPEELKAEKKLCCMSGFGGGLIWATLIMKVGELEFCENIISNL
jgi:3-oxoacyl-[acyl-carrier-protein] synthase-3